MPIDLSWATPKVPEYMTITISTRHLLAIAGVLRIADDDVLIEAGVLPERLADVEEAFEVIDGEVTSIFGEDWPTLTATPEQLLEEAEEEALWEDRQFKGYGE